MKNTREILGHINSKNFGTIFLFHLLTYSQLLRSEAIRRTIKMRVIYKPASYRLHRAQLNHLHIKRIDPNSPLNSTKTKQFNFYHYTV